MHKFINTHPSRTLHGSPPPRSLFFPPRLAYPARRGPLFQDTLLRAAAVSTRHIFDYSTSNTYDSSTTTNSGTRLMEDSFSGGNYRQASDASQPHLRSPQQPPAPQQQKPQQSSTPPPTGVDRNVSLLDLGEDENNLRTTCDGCTIGKIKCDGGHPCKRCLRRGSECIYREKK